MPTLLRFPDIETLCLAVDQNALPLSETPLGALVKRDGPLVWVEIGGTIVGAAKGRLTRLGIEVGTPPSSAASPVASVAAATPAAATPIHGASGVIAQPRTDWRNANSWAEVIPVTRQTSSLPEIKIAYFLAPDMPRAAQLVAEMMRLGCDRQALGDSECGVLLRVTDPPFFTVARAMDRVDGVRVFLPRSSTSVGARLGTKGSNQDVSPNVLFELGCSHPLAEKLQPDQDNQLLFVGEFGFFGCTKPAFEDLYERVEFRVPSYTPPLATVPPRTQIQIALRLVRAAETAPASLWVIRNDALATVERLVASIPDDVVGRLLFAVCEQTDHEPMVILRARPSGGLHKVPPALQLHAETYAPHRELTQLFLPCDAMLDPPIRRDRLRDVLAESADEMVWISRTTSGVPKREALFERALSPLSTWVEYLMDRHREPIQAWARSATFDFAQYVVADRINDPSRRRTEDDSGAIAELSDSARGARDRGRAVAPAAPSVAKGKARNTRSVDKSTAAPAMERPPPTPSEPIQPTEVEAKVRELEQQFLTLDGVADDDKHLTIWLQMGALHAQAGNRREAAHSLLRVLWEVPADDSTRQKELVAQWFAAEGLPKPGNTSRITQLASRNAGDWDQLRGAVASLVRAQVFGERLDGSLRESITRQLDQSDEVLDVRSSWLARLALSQLAGGDLLGLARARDKVLGQLHRGLSLQRDVPGFLRFSFHRATPDSEGGGSRHESEHVGRLSAELSVLQSAFEKTKRARSPIEAPPALSRAYIQLVLAWGAARLGDSNLSKSFLDAGLSGLDRRDPVHGVLADMFAARVQQSLEGQPPEAPLPPNVSVQLNSLEKFLRYKVDRLRQASQILEPLERLEPVSAFQRGERDPRGEEFEPLRAMADRDQLAREVATLMELATATGDEPTRVRLLDGCLDFLPQLPGNQIATHLDVTVTLIQRHAANIEPRRRVQLLEKCLTLAGHLGDGERVTRLARLLDPELLALGPEHALDVALGIGSTLRALRRVGLRDEATSLIGTLAKMTAGRGTPALVGRIHLAAARASLGEHVEARTTLTEATNVLLATTPSPGKDSRELPMSERLQIHRALSRALSHVPIDEALESLAKLRDQLPRITDSFNTNSHFCLSLVGFFESLVLGYASEELLVSGQVRRFLDEDEYLVRRRIHRDVT